VADNGQGEREQEQWGFGQIIAMLSVLAIAVETYKIFNEETEERKLHDKRQELEDRLKTANKRVQDLEGQLMTAQDKILLQFHSSFDFPNGHRTGFGRVATNREHRASLP